MKYRFFTQRDFDNCNPPCNIEDMNEVFMDLLDSARNLSGVPFILTSAYRSKKWEKEQGRDGSSSHTKGIAVDIKCVSSYVRHRILNSLLTMGFNRIGIGEDFIHVDLDKDKSSSVVWTYYGS